MENNFRDKNTGEEMFIGRFSSTVKNGEIVYIVKGKIRPELEKINGKLSKSAIRTPTKNR